MGDLVDVQALAPDVVLTSTVAKWDQAIEVTIDAWWDHMVNGVSMNAPMERIMFHMPQGGGDKRRSTKCWCPQTCVTRCSRRGTRSCQASWW